MEVTTQILEMGQNGKLIPVNTENMTDLQPGTKLHWGGPSEHDSIILSKKVNSFGVTYMAVDPNDKQLFSHFINAYQIKRRDDPTLLHSQHYFLTGETLNPAEVDKLKTEAEAFKLKRDKEAKEAELIRQEKIAKGKKIFERLKPAGAKALIIAEYEKDDSDIMTDYFATKTEDRIILA